MPRDVSGNYTLPVGNPVANATTIDILWANPTLSDLAVQLNNVFTRDGMLGALNPFKLVDGNSTIPGLSFTNQVSTGLWNAATTAGFSFRGTTHITSSASLVSFNVPASGTSLSLSSTLAVTGAITANGGVLGNLTGNASGSAGSVAWTNVSGRPTTVSSFTNDSGYITSGGAPVQSVAGRTGAVALTKADVGLTSAEDKSSATIRGEITPGNVTSALGFTPYNTTNPSGFFNSSSTPTFAGLVRGNGGGLGLGTITLTTTAGTPTGGSNGDFVLVY